MESLIATYAASDDEDDEQPQPSASLFSSLPQPTMGGLADKQQPQAAGSKGGGSMFSSLPHPKTGRLVDDEDEEQQQASRRAGSMFSSLPPPKKGPGKRTVEFRPPIDMSVFAESKREKRASTRPEPKSASGPTGGLVLPPPKNTSLGMGAVLGGGSRLSVMEDVAEEPAAHVENYPEAPSQGYEHPEAPSQVYEQAPSWNGGIEGQWEASSYSQGWDYGSAIPSGVEAQEDPVAKALQSERRKGKAEPVTFIQIKQEDLTANRPREDQLRITGIAFGSAFGPKTEEDEKKKPSKLHRRKHQIGSLLYDARSKEFELIERRARGQLSKSQTQAKYGW